MVQVGEQYKHIMQTSILFKIRKKEIRCIFILENGVISDLILYTHEKIYTFTANFQKSRANL